MHKKNKLELEKLSRLQNSAIFLLAISLISQFCIIGYLLFFASPNPTFNTNVSQLLTLSSGLIGLVIYNQLGSHQKLKQLKKGLNELHQSGENLQKKLQLLQSLHYQFLKAEEEGRASLSREIHDTVLQEVQLLTWKMENSELGEVATLRLQEISHDLRHLCATLRPPLLKELGLEVALEWLTQEVAHNSLVDVKFYSYKTADYRLPENIELNLYRICQEALNNCVRHAQAHQITVTLNYTHHQIELNIKDDGVGIYSHLSRDSQAGELATRPKFGLLGMHERVHLLGGLLEIRNGQSSGTFVQVRLGLEGRTLVA